MKYVSFILPAFYDWGQTRYINKISKDWKGHLARLGLAYPIVSL